MFLQNTRERWGKEPDECEEEDLQEILVNKIMKPPQLINTAFVDPSFILHWKIHIYVIL